ncbi:MAG: right-handed parallel beta-helix repeat-containing protein [Thermoplasmatota archaeon]
MTVSIDTVFPESDYELNDNMQIEPGVKVTFMAGCQITVPESSYYIGVAGELHMEGTQGKPIVLKPEVGDPERGMYHGIQFYAGSVARMNHTRVLNAKYGSIVYPMSDIRMDGCEFRNCSNSGVYFLSYRGGDIDYHPENVIIRSSKFIDNIVSVRENGINTTIDSCVFEGSHYSSLEVSHGLYPFSSGLIVEDSIFRKGVRYDVYLNGTETEEWVKGASIDHCNFNKGTTSSYDSIHAPGMVGELEITRNTFYRSHQTRKIRIMGGENITISWNRLYGNDGEDYQETILDLWNTDRTTVIYNTFYGSNPYRGNTKCVSIRNGDHVTARWNNIMDSCKFGVRIEDCTDAIVEGNEIGGAEYGIYVTKSAPVNVKDNKVGQGSAAMGWGIGVQVSDLARKIGDVVIDRNEVENCRSGIYINGNPTTRLSDNKVVGGIYSYAVDTLEIDCAVSIDNCTAENSSTWDLLIDGYLGNITVHARNCSMNLSKIGSLLVGLHQEMNLYWSAFVKASAVNEIGDPEDFIFSLTDIGGSTWYDGFSEGVTGLIEGSPLHLFQDSDNDLLMIDPHGALMGYGFRSGEAVHNGMVNLTQYRELFAILDHAPVFNNPAPIRFHEDTVRSFDPWDFFDDGDDIEVNEIMVGDNLTLNDASVTNRYENWTGQDTVTFRAVDTFGNHTDGTVAFIVDPVQDHPLITGLYPEIIMMEDVPFTLDLSEHMVDGDDDPLTWRVLGDRNLTLELNGTTWDLNIIPDPDYFGSSWIDVHLNDTVVEVHERIEITVEPINDPPVFSTPFNWNITVKKGEMTTVNISSLYRDVDDDDLIFRTDSEYVTVFSGELVILYPEGSQFTVQSVNIRVEDPSGANTTASILIFIENRTIIEPPDDGKWEITHVDLFVDEEGDWEIDVYGAPNMTLYIVIEGIGSFRIDESHLLPGNYSLDLDSDLFEPGVVYRYHFTNMTDGPDLAPESGGTVSQPGSEEEEERDFPWPAIIASIIVGLIVIIVFVLGMKARTAGEFEE